MAEKSALHVRHSSFYILYRRDPIPHGSIAGELRRSYTKELKNMFGIALLRGT